MHERKEQKPGQKQSQLENNAGGEISFDIRRVSQDILLKSGPGIGISRDDEFYRDEGVKPGCCRKRSRLWPRATMRRCGMWCTR